jgi:hypothetical protein
MFAVIPKLGSGGLTVVRAPRLLLFVVLVVVSGCSTPLSTREKGAITGGAVGAGTGAVIGSASGNAGTGALIGAGVGVVAGALIGDAMQADEQRQATAPPPPPPPAPVVAPPPPVAVVAPPPVVVASPQYIWVPQWGVYVVEGHDIVYHDGFHYHWRAGRWYVSRSHGGPWAAVKARPVALAKVPPGHIHRLLPPGHQKKGRIPPGHMR